MGINNFSLSLPGSHSDFLCEQLSDYERKVSPSTADHAYSTTRHGNSISRRTCRVDLEGFSFLSLRTQGMSVKSRLQVNYEYTFCMTASLPFISIHFQTMYDMKLNKV